ncbi:MAG: Endonuclease III [Chlamydiia bacterium]|nr:Endonuclease III [Chlamydiia bacterium]
MNKQERIEIIKRHLNRFCKKPKIPLTHSDPYTLLIAVLLSAQATDKKVNEITPALFTLANTPETMMVQDVEDIKAIIKPIGLSNTKAKNIKALSKILVEKFASKVPDNLKELESLPGVGHKTASVVMCQAFQKPAFPVDTHIHRCAQRWKLSSGKNVVVTEQDLKKAFSKESWAKVHLQIIYYAREHCSAKGHKTRNCPICRDLAK